MSGVRGQPDGIEQWRQWLRPRGTQAALQRVQTGTSPVAGVCSPIFSLLHCSLCYGIVLSSQS